MSVYSVKRTGLKYGVSDNAVRKWMKGYGNQKALNIKQRGHVRGKSHTDSHTAIKKGSALSG